MPELPEVEVVKKSLINKTQNLIVKAVQINDAKLRYKIDKHQIKKIIGLKIKEDHGEDLNTYYFFFSNDTIISSFRE